MQIKILSWNIWWDCQFEQVAEFLNSSNADIIGLQEVSPEDKNRDVIGYLTKLGYQYVFSPIVDIQNKGYKKEPVGNAIFSKFDILKSETHILSEVDSRIAIEADFKIGDKELNVFNVHLLHTHQNPSEIQALQAENLIKILPDKNTVVMGDFNATPESDAIKSMNSVLKNVADDSNPTWSLDEKGCPVCKVGDLKYCLDYIFVSKDIQSHSFKIENPKGSDHLPISVMIEI
ncbi:MAG: endonuclease/exonuclease/phosphatase family protein [Candidatus Paceibacterota bacterium]|jgi:endonuclease/exonuclease/phosphatase family metal-dependent hydrolase